MKRKHLIMMAALSTICILATGCGHNNSLNESRSTQNSESSTDEPTEPQPSTSNPTLNIETPMQDTKDEGNSGDNISSKATINNDMSWQQVYRSVIANAKDFELDPYNLEDGFNQYMYLGLHDFDGDNVPELIFGDGAAISVFTVEDNSLKKVADLVMTEEWAAINGVSFKDNTLLLESDGSNGSGYECFTYTDKYITGFYSDYDPNVATINGKATSSDEFFKLFDLDNLKSGIDLKLIDISDTPEQKAEDINFDAITF